MSTVPIVNNADSSFLLPPTWYTCTSGSFSCLRLMNSLLLAISCHTGCLWLIFSRNLILRQGGIFLLKSRFHAMWEGNRTAHTMVALCGFTKSEQWGFQRNDLPQMAFSTSYLALACTIQSLRLIQTWTVIWRANVCKLKNKRAQKSIVSGWSYLETTTSILLW